MATLTQAEARQHALQAQRGNMRSLEIVLAELIGGDIQLDNLDVVTLSINGTEVTATAAELNRAADTSARIVATTATVLALTAAAHGSKVVLVNSTSSIAITLPAATGSGEKYTLVIGVDATATAHSVVVANTADAMTGVSVLATTATGEVTGFATTATDDTISLNGTTKGGAKGDRIEIIDVATAIFQVSIVGRATGTVVTPFSAGV